jgi:Domain of unknown function (DUF222)
VDAELAVRRERRQYAPAPAGHSAGAEDWPLERLEREIGELAAHIHAATCRWLLLVAEFDRREGWAEWGCKSCAQWLSWRCALAPSAAREQVRVAKRLSELPQIRAAFGRGELSYSQVRALSRVATPELEPALLEVARHATAAQLERTLRAYRGVLERELTPADHAHGDRYLVCEHDDDGSLLLRARLPAEEGALVVAALDAARDSLRVESRAAAEPSSEGRGVSAEAEAPPATNVQALLLMAETLLSTGAAERSGGDSYQVIVHVDAEVLATKRQEQEEHAEAGAARVPNEEPESACQLDDGQFLHPETARRLACDASVVRILERDGRPLSVGRRTRSVPPALRRALQSRDHCCRFPGCTQRRFLHAHHIDHWAHGGPTELTNLVQLCRFHHRLVHEGGYTLERGGPPGELRFRRPDGRPISALPDARQVGHDDLERRNHRGGLRIGPDTCASRWAGDRLDLALTVDALVVGDARFPPEPENASGRPEGRPLGLPTPPRSRHVWRC